MKSAEKPCSMSAGAMKRLAEMLDVKLERTAAIGDGPNDVEMFNQAGLSIAMRQAVDKVKLHAAHVTASNDEDGWAQAMTNYVLQRVGTGAKTGERESEGKK